MTGNDLLEMLKDLSEEELEYPVYVYADHGQTHMSAEGINIETTTGYEYDLDESFVHEEDRVDYNEDQLKYFIAIC